MHVGRYQIISLISQGGMSEVYLATLKGGAGFQKQVVLKRIKSDLAKRKSVKRLFIREATLTAQLSHHNIVHVFDFGFSRGRPYLVMEHIDGVSLRDLMDSGINISEPMVASILKQMLSGLAYAFDKKIIHRDISPGNILIDRNGQLKIADFGLAKFEDEPLSGEVWGKLKYLAPEVKNGLSPDQRSDLYSVGVIGKELIGDRDCALTPIVARLLLPRDERLANPGIIIPLISAATIDGREELSSAVESVLVRHASKRIEPIESEAKSGFREMFGRLFSQNAVYSGLTVALLCIFLGFIGDRSFEEGALEKESLQLNAVPWAYLFIDGKYIGETPFIGKIERGDHAITLINPVLKRHSKLNVRVKHGVVNKVVHYFSHYPQRLDSVLLKSIPKLDY